jgi:hypothetical protein
MVMVGSFLRSSVPSRNFWMHRESHSPVMLNPQST